MRLGWSEKCGSVAVVEIKVKTHCTSSSFPNLIHFYSVGLRLVWRWFPLPGSPPSDEWVLPTITKCLLTQSFFNPRCGRVYGSPRIWVFVSSSSPPRRSRLTFKLLNKIYTSAHLMSACLAVCVFLYIYCCLIALMIYWLVNDAINKYTCLWVTGQKVIAERYLGLTSRGYNFITHHFCRIIIV